MKHQGACFGAQGHALAAPRCGLRGQDPDGPLLFGHWLLIGRVKPLVVYWFAVWNDRDHSNAISVRSKTQKQ